MMKHLILSILFFSQNLLAADPPVALKGQASATSNSPAWNLQVPFNQSTKTGGINALIETGNGNLLANPGFEHVTFSTGWTASGGSSAVGTSGDIGTGLKSYVWDASASSQTLISTAVTIQPGLYANRGQAACSFKTTATDYKIQAYDGSVLAEFTILPTATFSLQTVNFTFPSSGSIQLRIISQSNAAAIAIDDCYIGKALNYIGTVATSSSGLERIERAYVGTASCTSDPCTIASQTGSWLSQIRWNSTGQYTLEINPGIFSATPTCVILAARYGATDDVDVSGPNNTVAPSATRFSFATQNDASIAVNASFQIICMGPN